MPPPPAPTQSFHTIGLVIDVAPVMHVSAGDVDCVPPTATKCGPLAGALTPNGYDVVELPGHPAPWSPLEAENVTPSVAPCVAIASVACANGVSSASHPPNDEFTTV